MVDIELSGVLEERLRRLVELGIYSSISEAVRDAVRRLLEQLDLKSLALKLYLSSDASFQYIVEFADTSFDEMIDYMVGRGYIPLIGADDPDDVRILEPGRSYVLDPLTIYIIYRSGMLRYMKILVDRGFRFFLPDSIKSWVEVISARRLFHAVGSMGLVGFFSTQGMRVRRVKLTRHEQYAIQYARDSKGSILITDDIRTRSRAREMGLEAASSLSILYTIYKNDGLGDNEVLEIITALKSIPYIIADEVLEELGLAP